MFTGCTCCAGTLSVTDSDDDYCISYAVTTVDVRSRTRPPRLPSQTFNNNHTSMYGISNINCCK